jgi:hypothetical protein
MASRKTTFEVVKLDDIAALLGDAQEAGVKVAPKPARILSVTYDQSLAVTREMLFASVGFQVSSALTIDQAIQFCAAESFDLVVVGQSIPRERRQLLLKRAAPPVWHTHTRTPTSWRDATRRRQLYFRFGGQSRAATRDRGEHSGAEERNAPRRQTKELKSLISPCQGNPKTAK